MKAENVIKTAGVVVNVAGKVADVVSKSNSDNKKLTCETTGKVIDATATISKSVLDATQTTHSDVELTEEYKKTSRLDEILATKLKLISEGKMTSELEEKFKKMEEEEEERKANYEDRASEERCKKRVDIIVGGSVMTTIVGVVAMGVIFVSKKKF